MQIQELAGKLQEQEDFEGYSFNCRLIPGDEAVLRVQVGDLDELPCYLSVTDSQLLCITRLFTEEELKPKSRVQLLEQLLDLNVPMPLSSFARIGRSFVIFGALGLSSSVDEICREIIVLSENAADALEDLQDFLL